MKFTLQNKASVYSDASLRALGRLVFTKHCPFAKLAGYHLMFQVHATRKTAPRGRLTGTVFELWLPPPARLDIVQVVGTMRAAVFMLAGVAWGDMPRGDCNDWPPPMWIGEVRPLEIYTARPAPPRPEPTANELAERAARTLLIASRDADATLKRAKQDLARAKKRVKFWEKRSKQIKRRIAAAEKRFLVTINPETLRLATLEEIERLIEEMEVKA